LLHAQVAPPINGTSSIGSTYAGRFSPSLAVKNNATAAVKAALNKGTKDICLGRYQFYLRPKADL